MPRFLLAALLLMLSGCRGPIPEEEQAEGLLTIAFIPKSSTDPFWLDAIAGAERAAGQLGVKLLITSTQDETLRVGSGRSRCWS